MKYRKYELAIFCLLEAAFKIHLAQKSLWMGMTPLPPFITLLSSVKKWSCLYQERNLHSLQAKTVHNSSKQCGWILMWETTGDGFFTGGSVIMDSYFSQKQRVELKNIFFQTCSFSLHKTLTDGLEWCGLLCCFYQLFGLSFWRHPFTAEHTLLNKWCNATFLQIWWRHKLICEHVFSKFLFSNELIL